MGFLDALSPDHIGGNRHLHHLLRSAGPNSRWPAWAVTSAATSWWCRPPVCPGRGWCRCCAARRRCNSPSLRRTSWRRHPLPAHPPLDRPPARLRHDRTRPGAERGHSAAARRGGDRHRNWAARCRPRNSPATSPICTPGGRTSRCRARRRSPVTLSRNYNLTGTGEAVLLFSTVYVVQQTDCTAAGLKTCPNLNLPVFTQRVAMGNTTLRTSQFGTPPATYIGAGGNIAAADYCAAGIARGHRLRFRAAARRRAIFHGGGGVFRHARYQLPGLPQFGWRILCSLPFLTAAGRGGKAAGAAGFVLLTTAAMVLLVLIPAIGLAVDVGMMYLVQSVLSAASDAASLAGARAWPAAPTTARRSAPTRSPPPTPTSTPTFPPGYFGTTNLHGDSVAATDSTYMRSITTNASVDCRSSSCARWARTTSR
jgi:hypothetical protein